MSKRYRRKKDTMQNASLLSHQEKLELKNMIESSRYLTRNLNDFITEFFTKHELEKYYGYKMDMRRYLLDNREILKTIDNDVPSLM